FPLFFACVDTGLATKQVLGGIRKFSARSLDAAQWSLFGKLLPALTTLDVSLSREFLLIMKAIDGDKCTLRTIRLRKCQDLLDQQVVEVCFLCFFFVLPVDLLYGNAGTHKSGH